MKTVDDNLLAIFKAMFNNRNDYKYVTDEQKDKFFFIINRNMSKKYPYLAQLVNDKSVNKSTAMDLWFNFMYDKPYPKWFWSKSDKVSNKSGISEKEKNILLQKFDIKQEELDILISKYHEEFTEELKYIRELNKNEK